jgi:MSHA pilin protein MshC
MGMTVHLRRRRPEPATPVRAVDLRHQGQRVRQHGFTLVELVMVVLLIAILAAVVVPRMDSSRGLTEVAWRDQVLGALLQARLLAQGHRRLVCASVATGEVRLTMAAANPATTCGNTVPGPDGDARWARDGQALAVVVSPAGTLYFQPDGRLTSDGAGSTPVNVSISISGLTSLTLVGETGHVQ